MRVFQVFAAYRQFYVADIDHDPRAPAEWTDEHVRQRHNTQKNIAALCPVGDITVRIISCGPGENASEESMTPDFEVRTQIEVPSGKIGVFGWPWELQDQYSVPPGMCEIIFKGYQIDKAEDQGDFYVVKIQPKKAAL